MMKLMMVRYNVANEPYKGKTAEMMKSEIMKAERPLQPVPIREGTTGGVLHLTSAPRQIGLATTSRRLTR